MQSITIPKNVTSIEGNQVFGNCTSLKAVRILCDSIGAQWFYQSRAIESVTFAASLKSIGERAFFGCEGLTSISIPASVAVINYGAFAECTSLANVTMANSETYVAQAAFEGTPWLNNQPDGLIYMGKVAYLYHGEMPEGTNIVIKDGTQEIAASVFAHCKNLASVVIPGSVKTIGSSAFMECSGLTAIDLPEGLETLGDNAFSWCNGLTSIVIPRNVKEIGHSVFSGCQNLAEVEMSPNLTSIGSSAFQDCKSIRNLVLPDALTSIQSAAFKNCSNLSSISFGKNLKSIGSSCFAGCSALTAITLPGSVTSIGSSAFQDCSLTTVTVGFQEPLSIYSDVFSYYSNYTYYSYTGLATLYVPAGCKEAYEAAAVWKDFKEIIEMEPEPEADSDVSQLDNVIYLNQEEGFVGKQLTLSLQMKNSAAIRGFQFDMYLPEGVTVVKNSKGRIQGSLSSGRLPEDDVHTLTITEQEDGAIRFLCGSQYDEAFTGSDGEIATLTVQIAEDVAEGDYPIILKAMKLTETDISKFYETEYLKSTLTVYDYIMGDGNGDGKVDVSDYIGVANHIIGSTPADFNLKAADVDVSGGIDVSDYIGIANLIMTGSIYGRNNVKESTNIRNIMKAPVYDTEENVIYIEPLTASNGSQVDLSICMKNWAAIRGFQFDLYLPDGVSVVTSSNGRIKGSLSSGRLPEDDEHTLTMGLQDDGAIRFLCGSQYDETFTGTDGEIATLTVQIDENLANGDYPIILKNMKLTETDIRKFYESDEVETVLTVSTEDGIGGIVKAGNSMVPFYNLSGQRVQHPHKGLNIKGCQKVLVR